jgi:hypothetical protein
MQRKAELVFELFDLKSPATWFYLSPSTGVLRKAGAEM